MVFNIKLCIAYIASDHLFSYIMDIVNYQPYQNQFVVVNNNNSNNTTNDYINQ